MRLFKPKKSNESNKKLSSPLKEKSLSFFCNNCNEQKEGVIVKPEMKINYDDFQKGR
jgi:hypothetical protein